STIAYELLGGALSPLGSGNTHAGRYSPLANLSEAGNELLRHSMQSGTRFESAADFAQALRASEADEMRRRESASATSFSQTSTPGTPYSESSRRKFPLGFSGGVVSVGVFATILYFSIRQAEDPATKKPGSSTLKTATTPSSTPAVATPTPES